MPKVPLPLIAFVTSLGVAVQIAIGILVSITDQPTMKFTALLFAAVFPTIYAALVCYRRGFEAGQRVGISKPMQSAR